MPKEIMLPERVKGPYWNFNFELKVLKKFEEMDFTCRHEGVDNDPDTKKTRGYDIRGIKILDTRLLRASVEGETYATTIHWLQVA